MVEKKFNFYNVYKFYYKNINKSIFFYDLDNIKDISSETDAENISKFLINYFGIFSFLSFNFILYTDMYIFRTILKNNPPLLKTNFLTLRIFLNKPILNHTLKNLIIKNNTNLYLICLK